MPSRCTVGSPVVTSAERPVASPASSRCTCCARRGSRPPDPPWTYAAIGGRPDQGGPLGDVAGSEQLLDRDRAPVAEPRLAVGHRQLPALGDRVDALLRRRVERLRPELVEHRQHLQERRPLPPEAGLRHLDAVPLRDDGLLPGRGERRQVRAADQPGQHLATGVPPLACGRNASTASATKPCAPLVAGRLGLRGHVGAGGRGRPRPGARAPPRRPGWRTARPRGARPSRSHRSAEVVQLSRNRSCTRSMVAATRAEQRVPVAGVADRRLEHGRQRQRAVVAQQEQPGVDGARHRRGQRSGARDVVEAHGRERLGRRSRRGRVPGRRAPAASGRSRSPRSRGGRRRGRSGGARRRAARSRRPRRRRRRCRRARASAGPTARPASGSRTPSRRCPRGSVVVVNCHQCLSSGCTRRVRRVVASMS